MSELLPEEKVKRPASQYYWGDWFKDLALQSCSLPARGLWHEMNCLMHQGEPYGHLTMPNGKPMGPNQLANLCKITPAVCKKLIAELEDNGVFSRAEGLIFSRRMVRDEDLRNRRAAGGQAGAEHGKKGAEAGSKGGRPSTVKGGEITPLGTELKPPPSSSSSSSPSGNTPQPPKGGCRRFEEFWTAWPKSERKQDKVKCAEKWRRLSLDDVADAILADIAAKRNTEKWQGGFIEAPLVYLNGRRWEDGGDDAAGQSEVFV